MTKLTLLRHGRTVANAGGRLQGRIDNPLDDLGRRQAAAAAAAIGPVDLIISSPLRRAQDTAAAFAGEIRLDERWVELDYGDWDGLALTDVPAEVWERWRSDIDLRPPGGETLRELSERVTTALEELAAGDHGHVLVVSHVSPIKAAVAWGLGLGHQVNWRTRLATGSFSQLNLRGDDPVLTAFNVVARPPDGPPG